MKTQALIAAQPHDIALRDVELIEMGDGDVLVQTAYTSISAGTERMVLAGQMPHPALRLPVVPGYETVGRIVAMGADVPPEMADRWVYVGGAHCYVDLHAAWGGQSAHLVVAHERVVPLDGLAPQQGVLLALGATALHAIDLLEQEHLLSERRVLILGQGPVGQFAARIARARGAWVAVTDTNAGRLEHSRAEQRLLLETPDQAPTLDTPVDTIIEATGSMAALATALPTLANGGVIMLLGYYQTLQLPYMPLFLKQARLLTAREWAPGDLKRMRDLLLDGSVDAADMLTHTLPIAQATQAYQIAFDDPACLKMLLTWTK